MMFRLKKKSIKLATDLLLLYLLLFLTSGFHNLSGNIILAGCILISVFIFLKQKKHIKLSIEHVLFILLILIHVVLFFWLNGETAKNIAITVIFILTTYVYTLSYDLKYFNNIFSKLVILIALISIIIYLLALLFPNVITLLPEIKNSLGVKGYFAILTIIRPSTNLFRNQGIFWEPGAFQTFINLALLIIFFNDTSNIRKKYYSIIILYIALITTFSTTGYITGILLLFTFMLEQVLSKRSNNKNKYKLLRYIIFISVIGVVIFIKLPLDNKFQVFSKLEGITDPSRDMLSSTSVRLNAIKYTFLAFVGSPIVGNGYTKISELAHQIGFKMFTNTPINWMAIYGVFLGMLFNSGLALYAINFTKKLTVKLGLLVVVLLSITTEEYSRNPSILIFTIYFYVEYFKSKQMHKNQFNNYGENHRKIKNNQEGELNVQ